MSLPTSPDLFGLAYPFRGTGFTNVVTSGEVDTSTLEYPFEATGFVAPTGSPAPANSLFNLQYAEYALPFIMSAGKDGVNTFSLQYGLFGLPALAPTTTTPSPATFTELLPIRDSLSISFDKVSFDELLPLRDSLSTAAPGGQVTVYGTIVIEVKVQDTVYGTTVLRTKANPTCLGSTRLNVLADNLVPITSASSLTNPTKPTLVLGGNVIYSHPETIPPNGLTNARCYVNFLCSSLFAGQQISNFFSWNISIDSGRGTWRTNSITDLPYSLTDPVQIFGLTGVETEKGRQKTAGSYSYINGGILGTRRLNQPVAYLYNGNPQFTALLPNQNLLVLQNPADWLTYSGAALAIGAAAGVTVNWAVQDFPMTDGSFQAGNTGIEALESIAEGIGAKLRFNGGTAYTVVLPNKPLGLYIIPDCCLIQSMSTVCSLDVKTGIYNPGVYVWPNYPTGSAGVNILPNDGPTQETTPNSFNRQVEVIYTSSKKMTALDPSVAIDLPNDFEDVMIRIKTLTDGEGRFVSARPEHVTVVGNNNVLEVEPLWFLLQTGVAGGLGGTGYVNYNDINGVLQPQVNINYSLFPQDNTDVNDGHFTFQIGVIKKKQTAGAANPNQVMGRTWLRFRFIPVCQYNITCIFDGTIPMPGTAVKATIGDYTIGQNNDVIIEHVDFTNPGILNITAIQWAEIEYYQYLPTAGD